MAATTTIRLPPKLRARLSALAKQTGRSAHSLIVEAVEHLVPYVAIAAVSFAFCLAAGRNRVLSSMARPRSTRST
jgi:predicted DNA-binding protein